MNNMLGTIIPKSDQINADDLIGGQTLTITVSSVEIRMDEQPVSIHFEGDGGKPYKPGKSMRRVLVNVWGPDANHYVGRSMTLYRDDAVKFGGLDVGGIRISHMSHITKPVTMALTATRANRKPFTVKPLIAESAKVTENAPSTTTKRQSVTEWLDALQAELTAAESLEASQAIVARDQVQRALQSLKNGALDRLEKMIAEAQTRPWDDGSLPAIEDEGSVAAFQSFLTRIAAMDLIALNSLATNATHRAELRAMSDAERAEVERVVAGRKEALQ